MIINLSLLRGIALQFIDYNSDSTLKYPASLFFFFFFFNGPVISTECTAALGLLCCPSITFSTVLITLHYVQIGTDPLSRLCLCPLVLQSVSQRHHISVEPTPRIDRQYAALFQSLFLSICRLDLRRTGQ
jgi:hypothetical protein